MQRHHYVPKFYLREWHIPGRSELWIYRREGIERLSRARKSSKSVGYVNGLYSILPDPLGLQEIVSDRIEEKFFSPLDSAASQVYRKLIELGVSNLSEEDRVIWSIFLNSLINRTPLKIDEIKDRATKSATQVLEEMSWYSNMVEENKQKILKKLDIPTIVNNSVLLGMVDWILDSERICHFLSMKWCIVKILEEKDHFLTGDNPVVINAASCGEPIHALSIALSPSALFVMHTCDDEFDEDIIKKLTILHNPLIAQQTRRYLVSSRELSDEGNMKYLKIANLMFSR